MSYYAYASGEIAVKRDLTQDQILKLYENCVVPGTKKIMLRGQEYEIHTVDELVEKITEGDEAFEEINVDERNSNAEVLNLTMYAGWNYHEDDVKETLEILAPITIDGSVRYSGDGDDTFWTMYPAFTETTEIHVIRMDGMDIDQNVTVMVYHLPKLDVLNSIDACMTAWYKTEEGRAAWEYSCGDYNIGDWLCGAHPSDEFTANYGFLLDACRDHKVIEIDFDRILGDAEDDDDEA